MRGQAHGRHELSILSSLYRLHIESRQSVLNLFYSKWCDRLKAPLWEGDGFLLLYKKMEAVIKNALSYEEILAFIKGVKMGYEKIRTKKN